MKSVLTGYQPEKVYYYFEEVAKIPRNSFEEKAISDYLVAFAQAHGLEYTQDEHWNVVMEKPATKGYEQKKKIILQGHMDMVCVQEPGTNHDFSKDPIKMVVEDGYVHACGTTLGADDGNALAIILAILDDDTLPHPALQAIFTVAEEVGMLGAVQLSADLIDGDYLIGLDYSDNTKILVASAGTCVNCFTLPQQMEPLAAQDKIAYQVGIKGLLGGHSGGMIIQGRANAIVVLGEVLHRMQSKLSFALTAFRGGDKTNAIPNWAEGTIIVAASARKDFQQYWQEAQSLLQQEYAETDKDITLTCEETNLPAEVYSKELTGQLLNLISLMPDGLQSYLDAARTMVKGSSNLGIVSTNGKELVLDGLARGNTEYQLDRLVAKFTSLAELCGAQYTLKNRATAWEFARESAFRTAVEKICEQKLGAKPGLDITHGGTEPGIFIGKMQEKGRKLEAVNLGPHNIDVHTPRERMELVTLAQTYDLVTTILKEL